MPRREIEIQPGSYYHIYNRGVNKNTIFFEPENYRFFLRRMKSYLKPDEAEVIAYCLMPNHFHFIICPLAGKFSDAFGQLCNSYAKALNRRYDRVGPLFQGRFQAKWIDKNEYLLHLSRYLQLNPVLGKLVQQAEEWEFSSYCDYIGLKRDEFLKPGIVLEQFSMSAGDLKNQHNSYQAFVEEYREGDIYSIKHLL